MLVVLLAGLSQVTAQSVILFANRVKPVRFVLTLLTGVVLFAFGYFFLVLSTWLVSFAPFTVKAPFEVVVRTLGISYAPLIFSIFGAMPYLGEPILSLLSLWHLLAIVFGFAVATDATVWQAFGTVGLGWLMVWILPRTIGQPIANLGYWIACQAAGVELVTRRQSFLTRWQQDLRSLPLPHRTPVQVAVTGNVALSPKREPHRVESIEPSRTLAPEIASKLTASRNQATAKSQTNSASVSRPSKIATQWGGFLILMGGTFITIVLLAPIRYWWFAWYEKFGGVFQLVFNLVWIGIIALIAAALVAPWGTLGWWAGWYGDRVDSVLDDNAPSKPTASQTAEVLGSTLEDHPLPKIARSLLSWRTILPRLTSDEVTQVLLKQGSSAQVLRTNQVGGVDSDIQLPQLTPLRLTAPRR